jgi:predicted transposase YbfD/YdcC
MEEIVQRFTSIEDPRHSGYIKYKLADVLSIILCAVLCGLDDLESLHVFAESNRSLWAERLGLTRIPSKSTFGRILSMVDADAVGKAMAEILQERFGTNGNVVAVDGKAVCSTGKDGQPHSALQILTAYMTENGVILGQESIHEKTNEIPVFQQMLDYLSVKGKVVTADAMHCQRETCAKIVSKQGNYVLGLKQNQPSLYEDISLYAEKADAEELEICQTVEKNAGRIEKRVCRKFKDISWLLPRHDWPGLRSVFLIERIVDKHGEMSRETSYYISSLDAEPEQLMTLAREHWKIESMHWMLDVTFSEDDRHFFSENAHKTLNIMRKYALAVHKNFLSAAKKRSSIKSNMFSCLLDRNRLLKLLEFL